MKNSLLDREIRSRIDALLTDISALVMRSALDAVSSVLGGATPPPAAAPKRGPGRPRKNAAAPRASAAPTARRDKRAKRTSEDVQATADAFLTYVKANPGQSTEQIGKALGMATKELQLPVVKLVQSRAVRTEGKKRGTRYFAAGRRKAAAVKSRSAAKKKAKRRAAKQSPQARRKARAKAELIPLRKPSKPSPAAVTTGAASPEEREVVSAASPQFSRA